MDGDPRLVRGDEPHLRVEGALGRRRMQDVGCLTEDSAGDPDGRPKAEQRYLG